MKPPELRMGLALLSARYVPFSRQMIRRRCVKSHCLLKIALARLDVDEELGLADLQPLPVMTSPR